MNKHYPSSSSSPPPPLPPPSSSSSVAPGNGGNVDRVLFKNLVEIVPLVESLMDKRSNSSFTRRASMVYTPTPSHPKKIFEQKGRKTGQTVSAKKRRDNGENVSTKLGNKDNQDGGADDYSIFSSRALAVENIQKDKEDMTMLKDQVEDLQKKLLEKDEVLKSMENSMNQMNSVYVTVDELKRQIAEKDSLVRSATSQLSNAKINLADKQAALEKLGWEARTSKKEVEKLQGDLDSIEFEITAFMQLLEGLSKSDLSASLDENTTYFEHFDHLPNLDLDEVEMEEARRAYLAALDAAKQNPSEELIATAAETRLRLHAFVL